MQRLQFESSPFYILVCLAVGLAYAALLYRRKHTWSLSSNWVLFSLRAILVTVISLLLLNPILKFTNNMHENPAIVFLLDNSSSVKEVLDSIKLRKIESEIISVKDQIQKEGYEVLIRDFSGNEGGLNKPSYPTSDLATEIKNVTDEFEGKNLSRIVLVSDGIYNSGVSPLYSSFRIPITTVGIGDSSQRKDIILKNLAYNKIAYQGNKFPLRAEILVHELLNKELTISVFQSGKKITSVKQLATKPLLEIDFQLLASEKGLQRVDVVVEPLDGETNLKNNRLSAYVEVVEGKKKIVVIAPAPHPDIKALRSVVEKNSNYEFILNIPGLTKIDDKLLQPNQADLIVFHEAPDIQNITKVITSKVSKSSAGQLFILSKQSDLLELQANWVPFKFENIRQRDEVSPSLNNQFKDFSFTDNVASVISRYPPVTLPFFGKFKFPINANVLMYQRIGSVITDRPLVLSYEDGNHKVGVILADGFWEWRLNEYAETEKTEVFDEVFGKLIQYLSTREDKRRFRSFPISPEFEEADPVIFESQLYNQLFEPIYGNSVQLDITNEKGATTPYNYVISKDGMRYRIGGLKEGVYKYKASTLLDGKREEVKGEFLVNAQAIETQNLTADFLLLKKLANNTGGKFYSSNSLPELAKDLRTAKAQTIIHSEDSFNPLINIKWVFFLIVVLIGAEWFLRKYLGSY